MEIRPRLYYGSDAELKRKWEILLEKARVDGPGSLLFEYDGGEIIFDGPCRTAEDLMRYHKVDPRKYLAKPIESTYWETPIKGPDGPITVQNHRLKIKVIPRPMEVEQFKEFAEGLPKHEIPEVGIGGSALNIFIGDVHAGAVGRDYNLKKIVDLLSNIAFKANKFEGMVNINLMGDIFESISGMNHPDTWKNIELHGADLIKETSKIIASFLRSINNLSKVRVVGGNHDRFNKDKKDGNDGGAANIIAYILEVMGFDVEFDSNYLVYDCDGIRYILEHGDKGLSKQNPYEKIFRLGSQDLFNIIISAHEHTRIKSPDGLNYRKLTIASLIPNNAFGDSLGREGTSGFTTIFDDGFKKPIVTDYTL